MVAIKA